MNIGDKIKDYEVLISEKDGKVKLSSLSGTKGLVIYFYPRDDTPGCTIQACDFRDKNKILKDMGFAVVGVSPDSLSSHNKFSDKKELNFPLISDEKKELISDFNVWGEKKLYGKVIKGVLRTTYILDPSLKILKLYKNVQAKGHVERVLGELKSKF